MTAAAPSVNATTSTQPGPLAPPPAAPGAAPVLPASNMDAGGAIAMLMRLNVELNEQAVSSGTTDAKLAATNRENATKKQLDALKKAVDAQEKARKAREGGGGFFSKITKNLGLAGLVGMCVGSVYIVAADLALHATGLMKNKSDLADMGAIGAMCAGGAGVAIFAAEVAIKHFGPSEIQDALDKGPTIKDDDVRMANNIALMLYQAEYSIALTVASGGTAAPAMVACVGIGISTATQVAQETGALKAVFGKNANYVAMGGAITGAAMSLGGSVTSLASGVGSVDAATTAVKVGEKVVSVAQGADQIVAGAEQIHTAGLQHDADKMQIDAKHKQQILEAISRTVDALIEDLKNKQEHASKTMKICSSMSETINQTSLNAGSLRA